MAGTSPAMTGEMHRLSSEGMSWLGFAKSASSRPWQPAPRLLALVVIGRLENRGRKCRLNMQDRLPGVGKAMLAAGRHDDQLPAGQRDMRVINPDVGLALAHAQYFLDRMQVVWRPVSRIAPLLKHTKLRRIVCRRRPHARRDTRPPFFARLLIHIDDLHRFSNLFKQKPYQLSYLRKPGHDGWLCPAMTNSAPSFARPSPKTEAIDHLGVTVEIVLHEAHVVSGAFFLHIHAKDRHALGHRRLAHNFRDRRLQSLD